MKKQYLYAGISILAWSTVATIVKLLLGSMSSIQVLCISSLFAALFLLIVSCLTGSVKKLKAYKPRDYLCSVLIGLPGTFFYYIFYYSGTALMPASQAFVVNYLWPIMCVIFACIILKEKMTAVKALALVLSFIGVIVVVSRDILTFEWQALIGTGLCVAGAVCYGAFTAFNQKSAYEKSHTIMISFFVSFLLTAVICLIRGEFPLPNGVQLLGIAWNGIVSIGIGTTLWQLALSGADTAKISNLAYVTPFLSIIWTWLILHEEISLRSLIGLGIIMLGILIQLRFAKSEG